MLSHSRAPRILRTPEGGGGGGGGGVQTGNSAQVKQFIKQLFLSLSLSLSLYICYIYIYISICNVRAVC